MLGVVSGRVTALHAPLALARAGGRSFWRGQTLARTTHVGTMTSRGLELRVAARQQQRQSLFHTRAYQHDRVLTASLGLVSGGVAATALLSCDAVDEELKGQIKSAFRGDAEEFYFQQTGRRINEPFFEDKNKKAVAALMAANTLVFALWRFSFRHQRLHNFMWRHFACSYNAVVYGKRFHTLLTSAFSHITFPHFLINMFMLWEFGPHIMSPSNNYSDVWYNRAVANSRFASMVRNNYSRGPELLSIDKFMALYFTSAMTSSALSAMVSKLRGAPGVFSIGASGAVSAVFTVSCLQYPNKELLLYGLFEFTAAQMLQLFTAINVLGAAFQGMVRVDCVGHLGGQAAGLAFHEAPSARR